MSAEESSWRTPNFRQSVVAKIEEAIRSSGMPTSKNSMEMENHVFQKAKTKEEYLGFVARLILHVREMNSKKNPALGGPAGGGGQNMQNPIDALQTLARQGSGNQMMGLVPPQGPAPVTATNLLQTLNQRPNNQQRMQSPVQKMLDNKRQTESQGGPDCKLSDDDLILYVLGHDSPAVVGLPETKTGETASVESILPPDADDTGIILTEPHCKNRKEVDQQQGSSSLVRQNTTLKTLKRFREVTSQETEEVKKLKLQKLKLSIEIMKKESYLKTLEILKREKELKLHPSEYAKRLSSLAEETEDNI